MGVGVFLFFNETCYRHNTYLHIKQFLVGAIAIWTRFFFVQSLLVTSEIIIQNAKISFL